MAAPTGPTRRPNSWLHRDRSTDRAATLARGRGRDIVFAQNPGHGFWVRVEIILVATGTSGQVDFGEMFFIGRMKLVDEGEVLVVATRGRPTQREAENLALAREQGLVRFLQEVPPEERSEPEYLTMGLGGVLRNGGRFTTDLAVVPPPPGEAVICTGAAADPRNLDLKLESLYG